jgi:hypothetical protein
MTEARGILQAYLDRLSVAVMAHDWPTYRAAVCLPFQLVTQSHSMTMTSEEQLRAALDGFVANLRAQRVTDYVRLVEDAMQLDAVLVTGTYLTHLFAGSVRLIEPFRSHITLRREEGRWRAASITNALSNSRWPLLLPRSPK